MLTNPRFDYSTDWTKKDPAKLTISRPTNFNHPIHVTYNPLTGEFDGMPELWSSLLQSSRITKQEQKQNPQAVIDALDFYQHAAQKRESKFMYSTCKSRVFIQTESSFDNSYFFLYEQKTDLTPPISADLADRFRQTVILASDKPTHERVSIRHDNDETPPPIAARPEKTKSIVRFSQENS